MPATRPMTAPASGQAAPRFAPATRAFASQAPQAWEQLIRAPVRWPRPSLLLRPLEVPSRRMAAGIRALGLHTVGDLLEHLPSDSREARTVAALRAGEQATVAVQVKGIAARAVRRAGMRALVEAKVCDASGAMRATFFNQPWLAERYPPGTRLLLHGKADGRGGFSVSHHALAGQEGSPAGAEAGGSEAVAHYPAANGVSSTELLNLVRGERPALAELIEALPGAMRVAEGLPDRASALAAMHFPRAPGDLEEGRRRLAFEELLIAQLIFLARRSQRLRQSGATALGEEPTLSERWIRTLPFALTDDQRRAIQEIRADLARASPMQRLLMGEVGSGKTVVALYAMLRAVEHGAQAALMAPTETLAEQHFATVQALLGAEPVAAGLLSGSTPAARRRDILAKLATGELSLIVGTHALIEPDVRFRSLAVAVIDEQHRFGVRQRAALGEGDSLHPPHTLHMTATPIPRTLALARYGDLDSSRLRELPAGRRPIRTRLVSGEQERADAYELLRSELRCGRQAYVVCPLISEPELEDGAPGAAGGGEPSGMRAASAELERLRAGELQGFELALLHGGMRAQEKQAAMAAFASGRAQVLVATTVIEVGIDVANASVILIENADRFGISQLHQLRGRVGRGEHSSSCLLVASTGEGIAGRLHALARHSDGFRLAEIDLQMRSEGELGGTRQSGVGHFRIARLPQDAALLERARARAQAMIERDPELVAPEHALLAVTLGAGAGAQAGAGIVI